MGAKEVLNLGGERSGAKLPNKHNLCSKHLDQSVYIYKDAASKNNALK